MLPDYANISVSDAQVQKAANLYYNLTGLRGHLTLENAMVANGTGAIVSRHGRISEFQSKTENITWISNKWDDDGREEVPVIVYALQFRSQSESCGVYILHDLNNDTFKGPLSRFTDSCYELRGVVEYLRPGGGNTNGAFRPIRCTECVPSV